MMGLSSIISPWEMIIILIFGHVLFDIVIQGEFVSTAKNPHNTTFPDIPWWFIMRSHAFVHAAIVYFVTGSAVCGAVEFVIHYRVDVIRCEKKITFLQDQIIHIGCKILYVVFLYQTTLGG